MVDRCKGGAKAPYTWAPRAVFMVVPEPRPRISCWNLRGIFFGSPK